MNIVNTYIYSCKFWVTDKFGAVAVSSTSTLKVLGSMSNTANNKYMNLKITILAWQTHDLSPANRRDNGCYWTRTTSSFYSSMFVSRQNCCEVQNGVSSGCGGCLNMWGRDFLDQVSWEGPLLAAPLQELESWTDLKRKGQTASFIPVSEWGLNVTLWAAASWSCCVS